jgi:glycerophosphoryl diester phosphodiesterase
MKIVAHRGYSARCAENSLAAFEQAIAAGADLIETDVRLSSDGIAMCWHDPDLARVTGIATRIDATTAAALAAIGLPRNARMHRLDEVLELAHGRVPVMLDVKVGTPATIAAIVRLAAALGMRDEIVYGVRTPEHAAALDATGARFARVAMPREPAGLEGFPLRDVAGVRLWEDQVDEATLARIRARGLDVWITAGCRSRGEAPGYIDAERLRALRAAGAAAVLVNDVALARAVASE